jgi:hypothetical protein
VQPVLVVDVFDIKRGILGVGSVAIEVFKLNAKFLILLLC